jgi:hypothetical protein
MKKTQWKFRYKEIVTDSLHAYWLASNKPESTDFSSLLKLPLFQDFLDVSITLFFFFFFSH